MRKIKVLQFPIANARGGITQYALNNWKFIDKERFQFDFATLSKELDFEQELIDEGCKVHYISCYAEDNEEQFKKEMNRILDEGYDIVHLHTSYWKSFIVEELAMQHKVPKIIVHSHSTMIDILDEEKRKEALDRHKIQKSKFSTSLATDFWACSQLAADWLFNDQIPKDRIKIMKNAIDLQEFSYSKRIREEYRKKLGLEDSFVIGHIGRFAYQKNHEMLIDIFNSVYNSIPNAKLLLIGTGNFENKIREKVFNYGIEDKVLFLGKRTDVNCLLQAMDLFLFPSLFEGLPIVLIEAQASGVKCLTSTSITREVDITENIDFLSLNIDEWVNKVIYYSKGYNRINLNNIISKSGYDIKNQIKELEEGYLAK